MIELLFGMMASGKSTYARRRAEQGAVVVNDDSIVMALGGGDYSLYRKSWKPLYKSVEMHIVCTAVAMGHDVIIDRPNLTRATRARFIALARALEVPPVCVCFPVEHPEVHAQRRFDTDGRGLSLEQWQAAAVRHSLTIETPSLAEDLDNIYPSSVGLDLAQ